MTKLGRPRALDDANRQKFCALVCAGFDYRTAAAAVGCKPITVRREANRNAEFEKEWRAAELAAIVRPLATLKDASTSNWRAATWCVERLYPRRFAKRSPKYLTLDTVKSMCNELLDEVDQSISDDATRQKVRQCMRRVIRLWDFDSQITTLARKDQPPSDPDSDPHAFARHQPVDATGDEPDVSDEPDLTTADDSTAPAEAPQAIPPNDETPDVNGIKSP